ncbi:MAG TPA: hypothetical protein VFD34_05175, partial [Clostridia bacterium]|nr:hypothetical protein [Clostridia bacterium]
GGAGLCCPAFLVGYGNNTHVSSLLKFSVKIFVPANMRLLPIVPGNSGRCRRTEHTKNSPLGLWGYTAAGRVGLSWYK